jgi:hypothetical protein
MAKGWPDLTLLRERDRRLVFAELKAESGRLREDQGRVLALLSAFATDAPATCGEFPRGMHEGEDRLGRGERRHACCPPWIQVFVWRPSDLEQIAEALR